MQELYTDKDLNGITSQLKKRYWLLGAAAAVLIAVFVWSMVTRTEWLSMVSLFLLCAVCIFVIDIFCLPLHRYGRLVRAALTGRKHNGTYEFVRMEDEISVIDGVRCRGLIFLGEPDKHGTREQRFYWDCELPLPSFSAGQQVTLKYTGRNIIGYTV